MTSGPDKVNEKLREIAERHPHIKDGLQKQLAESARNGITPIDGEPAFEVVKTDFDLLTVIPQNSFAVSSRENPILVTSRVGSTVAFVVHESSKKV